MKKLLYISLHNLKDNKNGVSKKINNQIESLRKKGILVEYTYKNEKGIFLNSEENVIKSGNIKGRKAISLIYDKISESDYDYIYIRYESTTFAKLKKMRIWKKNKSKIILEIPTYPYKGEYRGKKQKLIYIYKEIYNIFLYKYVDYIVTFSDNKEIWGIPCINISNGIDLDNTKLINKVKEDIVTFTSVSICAPWHGIDRFLISLGNYLEQNPTEKIKFNIVGEGTETSKLKQIVSKSKRLSDVVVFHGFKSGEELDAIYNETDIGVGCLGNHRKGIYTVQALKNKEYAAKGLPMIFSEDDPGLRGREYVYRATHDEQLVDITDLIKWYQNLTITSEEIRESIKEFSWENQMRKVVEKIQGR